jgi:Eukaryotic protein of unknown function (DUF1764)
VPAAAAADDIESMFAGKRKRRETAPSDPAPGAAGDEPALLWGKAVRGGRQRYTEDGLRILTEDDIKAENASSALNGECPFDCSCCF